MERSGIETLLEAAALDAASFFDGQNPLSSRSASGAFTQPEPTMPMQQQQQYRLLPPQAPLYSPANSPDVSYTTQAPTFPKQQQLQQLPQLEQQPSPYSPPGLFPPLPQAEPDVATAVKAKVKTELAAKPVEAARAVTISSSQEVWDACPMCTPSTAPQGQVDWIECGVCEKWFHYACVGLTPKTAKNVDEYHCPECTRTSGPSTLLRKSKRKHAAIDYLAMHQGESVLTTDQHPYCQIIQDRQFTPENFERICGSTLTKEFAAAGHVSEPVVIPAAKNAGLDMEIPANLTVREVANLVGMDTKVEVIDVPTQHESPNWNMQRWSDYYEQAPDSRDRVRNVISLEVSFTKLGNAIKRPKFVRDLDLVQNYWPDELKSKGQWPKVSTYCLMSVENSYTDFHIDFGGSSVYYHVVRGSKVFLFSPPTPANLSKYEHWCLSSDQSKTFLGDLVKDCYKVCLSQGDTMIIPSGWIHAVYTPIDSLVIGGNFLTMRDLSMQLKVTDIEKKTKVPRKFRFPLFTKLMWFTAYELLEQSSPKSDLKYSNTEHQGFMDLALYLYTEALLASGQVTDAAPLDVKAARSSIPSVIENAVLFSKAFANWTTSVSQMPSFEWAASDPSDKEARCVKKRKRPLSLSELLVSSEDAVRPSKAEKLSPTVSSRLSQSPSVEAAEIQSELIEVKLPGPTKVEQVEKNEVESLAEKTEIKTVETKLPTPVAAAELDTKSGDVAMEDVDETPASSTAEPIKATISSDVVATDVPSTDVETSAEEHVKEEKLVAAEDTEMADAMLPKVTPDFKDDSSYLSDVGSEVLSEASTEIEEETAAAITSAEGKQKNFALYQELMDLYTSRTRRRMQQMNGVDSSCATSKSKSKSPKKIRSHSESGLAAPSKAKKASSRRRRSTPGDNHKSLREEEESAEEDESGLDQHNSSRRSRGRPRRQKDSNTPATEVSESKDKFNIPSALRGTSGNATRGKKSDRSSNGKLTSSTSSSKSSSSLDLEDEATQRLIREAQFGIRSRR
ncbi:uncharacterized protein V1518DRAFT_369966 [Limtongia smithiae]|uniref:uncharacterized protein n=1 Tax=Limtongia smithiae TaxID=1125753 RepID=UPI0034CFD60A